jgi:hypothetical protein
VRDSATLIGGAQSLFDARANIEVVLDVFERSVIG